MPVRVTLQIHTGDVGAGSVVQTVDSDGNAVSLDINTVEAIGENQIIITGEDGECKFDYNINNQ